jgi:ATP-dependent RNA helicase SUPV3L1/SUV3
MRKLGADAGLLPVRLEGADVMVDDEAIGSLHGFRFQVDPLTRHSDRKLLLAAADKHLPGVLAERAGKLTQDIANDTAPIELTKGTIAWEGEPLARLVPGRTVLTPQLEPDAALRLVPAAKRKALTTALGQWLKTRLERLAPLHKLEAASSALAGGPELRALLIRLIDNGGTLGRTDSGVAGLGKEQRDRLRALGVRVGAVDLFVPAMLRPAPLALWRELAMLKGLTPQPVLPEMPPVVATSGPPSLGYRKLGKQSLRIDLAEKLLLQAHGIRTAKPQRSFVLDPSLARSMGLSIDSHVQLLRLAGFQPSAPRQLSEGVFGPPRPTTWRWRPPRRQPESRSAASPRRHGAFAALAELVG